MTNIIKIFFCGIICSLLFPPYLIFPLGFLVFPYLYFFLIDRKIQKTKKLGQFIYGASFGFGLNLIVLYWIKEPFAFNPLTENYSFLSFLLILYVSIYFGFVFIILNFFKNNFSKLIMMPVIFILAEIIRENFLFGFPWTTFALTASGNYFFLQIAHFIGTNGLSFILILLFLVPVNIIFLINNNKKLFSKIYLMISLGTLFFMIILIFVRLNFLNFNNDDNEITFSLNQLNINQSDKSNKTINEFKIKEIMNVIKSNKNTINVFSETDYPYIIENNDIVDLFQKNLSNNTLIIGGIRKKNMEYYNSLYFITENQFQFFDKKILVPFGEFLPFRKKLKFLEAIAGTVDFKSGIKDRFIENVYNNFSFVPVICYEIIFFNDLLFKLNQKIPIIINITNDAWFGKYSGPYQHFYLSRIRSVEFNKFLIRVSNNGISAVINNYGEIIDYIPLNQKDKRNLELNIPTELDNFYYFHKLIYLIFIIMIIVAIIIESRNEKLQSKI